MKLFILRWVILYPIAYALYIIISPLIFLGELMAFTFFYCYLIRYFDKLDKVSCVKEVE